MKTLKMDAKNNLYTNLFSTYGATIEGKFPSHTTFDFFNESQTIAKGDVMFDLSYYGQAGYTNALKPSFNIRKGILRLAAMDVCYSSLLGYVAHDPVTKELWVGYYDGTCEEINEIINSNLRGSNKPLNVTKRMTHMYGKGNVIEKAYIDDSGIHRQYVIGNGKGENSASAYMFYQAINLALNHEDKRIMEGFEAIVDFVNENSELEDEDKARHLCVLENDIYVKVCYMDGQSKYIPFVDFPLPDEDLLISGILPNSSTKKRTAQVKKKLQSVGEIAKDGTYNLNHSFAEDDQKLVPVIYDDYLPDENTLTLAHVLKSYQSLPEVPVMNILLTGEAGTGKSTAAQLLARLCNLPYRFITMSADTTVADLLLNILPGKKANTFEHYESEFVKAFRNGGIIEIQEVNTVRKPNVLTSLNAALDGLKELHLPNGEVIKRHDNCIVVFTANVGYEGTAPMNQALLSRCCLKLEYTLPEDKELVKRLVEKSGVCDADAEKMVKAMKQIQNILEEEGETLGICSFREITAWAQMTKVLNDPVLAGEITIVNSGSFDSEVKPRLLQAINNFFN